MIWEIVKSISTKGFFLLRIKTPDGWLVRSVCKSVKNIYSPDIQNISLSEALLFIADPLHSWDIDQIENWETMEIKYAAIFGNVTHKTYRLKVPGGWIVKTYSEQKKSHLVTGTTIAEAMCFVSDPDYQWNKYQDNLES